MLAQGRHVNVENVKAIIKVLAKLFLAHRLFKIFVGSGDQPDVRADSTGAAESFEFFLLQDAQQFDLRG